MNAWAKHLGIKNVKVIPDGNGELTSALGMLVDMSAVGFGKRSRRFAVIINDGVIEKSFVEPEASSNNPDPYGETSPESVMEYLSKKIMAAA
jgi:peroxiredoxin